MIVLLGDAKFHIPDSEIDRYAAEFKPLRNWENRGSLIRLRDDIIDIISVLQDDPELLYDDDFIDDLATMLAQRMALSKINLLHDA